MGASNVKESKQAVPTPAPTASQLEKDGDSAVFVDFVNNDVRFTSAAEQEKLRNTITKEKLLKAKEAFGSEACNLAPKIKILAIDFLGRCITQIGDKTGLEKKDLDAWLRNDVSCSRTELTKVKEAVYSALGIE